MAAPPTTPQSPQGPDSLADFLRHERTEILRRWEERVREMPVARLLGHEALLDHLPQILDRIAEMVEDIEQGRFLRRSGPEADTHALDRLEEGYDLEEVVSEFALLRECILDLWARRPNRAVGSPTLNRAIDEAVSAAVGRYTKARERTLVGLDRISTVALQSHDVASLLRALNRVLLETTPAVDSVAIFLRAGERLELRAAAGLEEELVGRLSVALDDTTSAGWIAGRRQPFELRDAGADSRTSEALHRQHARAFYGVPMLVGNDVAGIAHMASRTAYAFSNEDKLLFRAMVERATSTLQQQLLREALERERARIEEERRRQREGEERFGALADNIAQLAWIADSTGRVGWYNRRWFDYTGLSEEASLGLGWKNAHHPDHAERVARKFLDSVAKGEVWEDTFPLRGRDGTYRWFLSRAVPIRDPSGRVLRWFGTNTDVTESVERREQAALLDEATTLLSSSLDATATLATLATVVVPRLADWCTVTLVDEEGRPHRVAARHADPQKAALVEEYLRNSPPAPSRKGGTGKVLQTGEAELFSELTDELLQRLARDERHLDLLRRLGLRSLLTVPLAARGRPLGALGMGRGAERPAFGPDDLAFAQELGRRAGLAIDNARLYHRAQDAIRARDEFLSVASHDLRSPLTSLKLQVQTLARTANRCTGAIPCDSVRPKVATMERQLDRVVAMLEEMLDASRIHASGLSLAVEEVDFAALVHDVAARLEEVFAAAGCELRLDAPGPVVGLWDALRLEQIVTNLLSNAAKYGRGAPIEVTLRAAADRVVLRVRDYGVGIAPEHHETIFHRFERVGDKSAFEGTGLGLWIVKRIVDAMGGTIRVESTPGQGALFVVELPRTLPDQHA